SPRLATKTTEELQRYAEQYGIQTTGSREDLLIKLRPFGKGLTHRYPPPKPLPLAPLPFKFSDLKKAIPQHCFERNLVTSMSYLISDVMTMAALAWMASFIEWGTLPSGVSTILWPVYWFCQGTKMFALWMLAHECGHQAFSDITVVNHTVGLFCHSVLLVPYFSWQLTHAKHHRYTGSCENDVGFCPPLRSDLVSEVSNEMPVVQAISIVVMLTFGWMPGYLFFNTTGPKSNKGHHKSHFNPWAKMFEERHRVDIIISDLGFFATICGLAYLVHITSFGVVARFYIVPYMVTNLYLVLITFLQHTDVFMPRFRGKDFDWLRGALCTADRSLGSVIDYLIHHSADTHVCHHLFSKMPFYNAKEATVHIKKSLGDYYLFDPTPIHKALWRAFTCCRFIEDEGGTVFFKAE
ncbi:unnamed protein product, partial [Discosporangium mesarthrocarpum]